MQTNERACATGKDLSDLWIIDSLAMDATMLADLFYTAFDLMSSAVYVRPDGSRHLDMDRLNALLVFGTERLRKLADDIDDLPRPSSKE